MSRKLVDDPFNPGQRIAESMAEIHPSQRFQVAVERQFAKMAEDSKKGDKE